MRGDARALPHARARAHGAPTASPRCSPRPAPQRDETPDKPFTSEDRERLQYLYDEWAHPFFVSKEEYGRIMQASGKLDEVTIADWTAPTLDSWRHSILVGVWDPWIVVSKVRGSMAGLALCQGHAGLPRCATTSRAPHAHAPLTRTRWLLAPPVLQGPRIWYKTVREIVTLERMHRAFADGLMEYGMMKAVKRASNNEPSLVLAGGAGAAEQPSGVRVEVAP